MHQPLGPVFLVLVLEQGCYRFRGRWRSKEARPSSQIGTRRDANERTLQMRPPVGKIKKEITLKSLRTEDIRARLTSRLIGRAYSRPCSNFSWQAIQCLAHGTASNRFCCISSWQLAQTPYSSSWMRFSAASIRFKSERSVLVM